MAITIVNNKPPCLLGYTDIPPTTLVVYPLISGTALQKKCLVDIAISFVTCHIFSLCVAKAPIQSRLCKHEPWPIVDTAQQFPITMENHHAFNGYIHYFYGHVQ